MKSLAISIPKKKVLDFCQKWEVSELSFFGSIVQGTFHKESDVDILISYKPESRWTLFDHAEMEEELEKIFGRRVDLVSKNAIQKSRNWIRKKAILDSAVKYYES